MAWAPNGDVHVDFRKSDVADSVGLDLGTRAEM